MKNFYGFCIIAIQLFACASQDAKAQVTVTSGGTANQLAQSLAGGGISIFNATLTGTPNSYGLMQANGAPIGINAGVVLTTGDATNIIGPNNGFTNNGSTSNNANGDAQLTALSGYTTWDASILEFDLIPTADTLKFNYIFGSEEYPEWVGSLVFNDIFAFYISGPGITGQQNIALLPGSTTPVSINNVNCQGANPSYYICNDPANSICPASANCVSTTYLNYDGITILMQAKIVVQPCQTYHLKLGIADCTDHIYDSGVIIEAGSLTSTGVQIIPVTGYTDPNNSFTTAVEGCVDGLFELHLNAPATDTFVFHFGIGGTATINTDYGAFPDSVVFYPGDSLVIINVTAIADGLNEGIESIILYQLQSCNGNPYDTAIMNIADQIVVSTNNDTAVCLGSPVFLVAHSGPTFNYNWSPQLGLACATCDSSMATPSQTTTYTVLVSVSTCTAVDSTIIVVNATYANAGPDIYLCLGDSIQFNATGGVNYIWSPGTWLSSTNISNPWSNAQDTITYYLDVSIPIVGCNTQDTMIVYSVASLNGAAGNDTMICRGESANLWASGGTQYFWKPPVWLTDPTDSINVSTPNLSTTYTVIITNQFGCIDSQMVAVDFFPDPYVYTMFDKTIYQGDSVLIAAYGGVTYRWSPNYNISDTSIQGPVVAPEHTTTYYATVTTANGCTYVTNIVVNVINTADIYIPNAFSPNHDEVNDYFTYIARGIFNLSSFRIYNRWGELVWENHNSTKGWDGLAKGEPAAMGVYIYEIRGVDVNNKQIERKGNLTLIR